MFPGPCLRCPYHPSEHCRSQKVSPRRKSAWSSQGGLIKASLLEEATVHKKPAYAAVVPPTTDLSSLQGSNDQDNEEVFYYARAEVQRGTEADIPEVSRAQTVEEYVDENEDYHGDGCDFDDEVNPSRSRDQYTLRRVSRDSSTLRSEQAVSFGLWRDSRPIFVGLFPQ